MIKLYWLENIISNTVSVWLLCVFAGIVREKAIKKDGIFCGLVVITAIVSTLLAGLVSPAHDIYLDRVPYVLFIVAFLWWLTVCRNCRITVSIYIVAEFAAISILIEFICMKFLYEFINIESFVITEGRVQLPLIILQFLSCILKCIMMMLITNISVKNGFVYAVDIMHMSMAVITVALAIIFNYINANILCGLFLLVLNICMLIEQWHISKIAFNKAKMENIQKEIIAGEALYKDIEEGQEKLRDMRHDIKNRIMGVYMAAKNGENAQAVIDELGKLLENIDSVKAGNYSDNTTVNAIIHYKLAPYIDSDISINADVKCHKHLSISSGDMGVILGNLIDNAIEACKQVEKSAYINISGYSCINMWVLSIENSKSPVQTKKEPDINHGRGLKNVKNIVENHKGTMKITEEENRYIVELTFEI